eukprot:CAMPEP_0179440898 /NCGR_PEP_ID=MMETSP0799-20121207/24515_1 /TAXON_ID=46947 /ORGANISM="Geminigera cryophila, Strain CCMP2564" /LENGTH=392 /DNA_ID=CAMNT_0021224743 /DNA_START=16 /DNA_END=1192 /DNA_ORIENTATION=-
MDAPGTDVRCGLEDGNQTYKRKPGDDVRAASTSRFSISHIAIFLSCVGLFISMIHLCFVIHQDALESARIMGYRRGRAEATTVPALRKEVGKSSMWMNCEKMKNMQEASFLFQQHSRTPSDTPRTASKWASIFDALTNITAKLSQKHPEISRGFATMRQQGLDMQSIADMDKVQQEHDMGLAALNRSQMMLVDDERQAELAIQHIVHTQAQMLADEEEQQKEMKDKKEEEEQELKFNQQQQQQEQQRSERGDQGNSRGEGGDGGGRGVLNSEDMREQTMQSLEDILFLLRDGAGRRRSALHELTRCRVLQVADDTKMLPHSTHHEELQWTEEEGMWKEEKENEDQEADALALALYRRAKVKRGEFQIEDIRCHFTQKEEEEKRWMEKEVQTK